MDIYILFIFHSISEGTVSFTLLDRIAFGVSLKIKTKNIKVIIGKLINNENP